MTLDEAIKNEEKIAEENQRVVDTGIVFDDVTIDMLYCDDTEVIEEHLANYQKCAEKHRQLAEWLKELKQLKSIAPEQQTCEDAVSREAVLGLFAQNADAVRPYHKTWSEVKTLPPVTPQHTEAEIQKMQDLEQAELEKAYELGRAEGQKSEDVVSRQEVDTLVDELARAISDERCCISKGRSTAIIMQNILDLPPVNPQQRVGHWIEYDHGLGVKYYRCSICKGFEDGEKGKYCKWCGAKMVEPPERSEE